MPEVMIQQYKDHHYEDAVRVLTEAYLTNPIHIAVYGGTGPEHLRHERRLWSHILPEICSGKKLVAIQDKKVVGFVHWRTYPKCRSSGEKASVFMSKILAGLPDDTVSRLLFWLKAWQERDPDEPHNHFGPIAVTPTLQGTGIGRLFMQSYCGHLDRTGEVGYLETDRPRNVNFYAKSGFEVTSEVNLLGIPNWFMHRRAQGHPNA